MLFALPFASTIVVAVGLLVGLSASEIAVTIMAAAGVFLVAVMFVEVTIHAIANLRCPGIDRPRGVPFAKSPTRRSEPSARMVELNPCERCNGTGEIGVRTSDLRREQPGPVPDDARGWARFECSACGGTGVIEIYEGEL